MKDRGQPSPAPAEQPLRDAHPARGLAYYPDALTVAQVCEVLQISRSHYYLLVRHHQFPIRPLPLRGVTRYGKAAVQAFVDGSVKLSRVG